MSTDIRPTDNNKVSVGLSLDEIHLLGNVLADHVSALEAYGSIASILPGLLPDAESDKTAVLAIMERIQIAHELICPNEQPIPYTTTERQPPSQSYADYVEGYPDDNDDEKGK